MGGAVHGREALRNPLQIVFFVSRLGIRVSNETGLSHSKSFANSAARPKFTEVQWKRRPTVVNPSCWPVRFDFGQSFGTADHAASKLRNDHRQNPVRS